jgi:hypothetical protein
MDYQPRAQDDYTEDVRRSFNALNTVIVMMQEMVKARPNDTDLATVVGTLAYVAHDLFGRVTCMKLRDDLYHDDPVG